jgi:Flp pilus assembly protein TadG
MKKFFPSQQRGQTLIEFALILPAFLLLSVMIFDFGRAIYYYSAIHNAAMEGARYGSANPLNVSGALTADGSGIRNAVINYAVGLDLDYSNIIYADLDPDYYETVGGYLNPTVRVNVEYNFVPITPLVSQFICKCESPSLTLIGTAIMRTEWMPSP